MTYTVIIIIMVFKTQKCRKHNILSLNSIDYNYNFLNGLKKVKSFQLQSVKPIRWWVKKKLTFQPHLMSTHLWRLILLRRWQTVAPTTRHRRRSAATVAVVTTTPSRSNIRRRTRTSWRWWRWKRRRRCSCCMTSGCTRWAPPSTTTASSAAAAVVSGTARTRPATAVLCA